MSTRPDWDSSMVDPGKHRLSYFEQLTKKASFVSRNREAAREELRKKQGLLRKGVIPNEYRQLVGPEKKVLKKTVFEKNTPEKLILEKRVGIIRTTSVKNTQSDEISRLEQSMKELEIAMKTAMESTATPRRLEAELAEVSFDISDSSAECVYETTEKIDTVPRECNEEYYKDLIESTKVDLEQMSIPDPDFSSTEAQEYQIPFEEDLIPRQLKLLSIAKMATPRTGIRSFALTDNIQTTCIPRKKFII